MATGIRITLFGGIVPRLSDRGLPDNAAQFAMNAKLFSGELRAWNTRRALANVPVNSQTVFHYLHTGLDRYLAFPEFTNVVKAPLINETLGRLYWTGSSGPRVNTTTRIEASQPSFKLGVPSPGGTFTVVPSGGTPALSETRVYLATLVSTFGEESAPGNTVTVVGNADGTWTVNGLNALTIDTVNYPNIEKLRLYRTLTSSTGVDYRMVNEWLIGARPASYVDNVSSTTLAANTLLQTLGWNTPPDALRGLIGVAGGFLAGFVGRTVRLSVPYQPHSWPDVYQFAVEDDIVALGTFANTIVIATKGRAFLLIGPSPDTVALSKLDGVQPCLSARSLVSTVSGVMYASTDGIVLVDGATNVGRIISRNWVLKDEWMSQFSPKTQMSSIYQDRYFSFYTSQLGLTVGFDDPVTGFTELQLDGITSVDLDTLTGQTLITIGDTVYEWDGDTTSVMTYSWKSKPFLQPKPVNFAALQLRGSFAGSGASIPVPPAQGIGGYSLNSQVINGGKTAAGKYGGSLNGPPDWLAMGTSPAPPLPGPEVAVKVYGDGVLRWFGSVSDERVYRLPSGYKAVQWEVEVQGVSPLYSIALADTAKGLENIP